MALERIRKQDEERKMKMIQRGNVFLGDKSINGGVGAALAPISQYEYYAQQDEKEQKFWKETQSKWDHYKWDEEVESKLASYNAIDLAAEDEGEMFGERKEGGVKEE